jgi:hypothetical protein
MCQPIPWRAAPKRGFLETVCFAAKLRQNYVLILTLGNFVALLIYVETA